MIKTEALNRLDGLKNIPLEDIIMDMKCIEAARRAIENQYTHMPDRIDPTPDGGVCFHYDDGLEIFIENDTIDIIRYKKNKVNGRAVFEF